VLVVRETKQKLTLGRVKIVTVKVKASRYRPVEALGVPGG
jgi:hypothetical protein